MGVADTMKRQARVGYAEIDIRQLRQGCQFNTGRGRDEQRKEGSEDSVCQPARLPAGADHTCVNRGGSVAASPKSAP